MAKKQISWLTDYDVNSGVLENIATYKYTTPSLRLPIGTHIIKDLTRFYNEGFTFWFRTAVGTDFKYQTLLGCDIDGNGMAFRIDGTATDLTFRLVNISTFGNPTYDSVIVEKEVSNFAQVENNIWHEIKLQFVNSKLHVYFDDRRVLESTYAIATGNYFGHSSIDTANEILISDLWYWTDQIFWGNVNTKGIPASEGVVYLLRQDITSIYSKTYTDQDGNYMIFVEDDPVDLHKYIVIGYIADKTYLQPRGYGNLTL